MGHFAYPNFGTADTSRGCPLRMQLLHHYQRSGTQDARNGALKALLALLRKNYSEHVHLLSLLYRR